MKLWFTNASPYVRKVLVVAHETGLTDRLERIYANPLEPNPELTRRNPLGKIPTLETDDGAILIDSTLICEYLDSLHDGLKLHPEKGTAKWTALRQEFLANGILDAAVLCRLERVLRKPEHRSEDWIAYQTKKIERAVGELEREVADLAGERTIGHVSVGCALGYLDFRMPELGWRTGNSRLAAWYETFSARPSMRATVPREGL